MLLDIVVTAAPTSVPVYSEQLNKLYDLGYTATSILVFSLLMVVVYLLYKLFNSFF